MRLTPRALTATAMAIWPCGPGQRTGAGAGAQGHGVVLGMVLEPPGLDPTMAPAAAIGEIVHYNVLEGLTKVDRLGAVTPLLATDWTSDPDGKTYTFKLRKGVKFQDGTPFDDSEAVKFSFERAKAEGSAPTRPRRRCSTTSRRSPRPTPHTVILTLNNADATLPFRLGENTAVILQPHERGHHRHQAGGHRPFSWTAGRRAAPVTLVKWDGFRDAAA
jgi:peptide/nickel transport system substrate-binding protein